MQLLKKRILQDGKCYEGGILKVDGFINHQMDPCLLYTSCEKIVPQYMGIMELRWKQKDNCNECQAAPVSYTHLPIRAD